MKKLYFLTILMLFSVFLKAQNITGAEYFYNTDPGFGNGTAISLSGTNISETLIIQPPSDMSGFNNIYIRVKNANDKWSFYGRANFYVIPSASLANLSDIESGEYFFNTDPGFGNGTPINISGTNPTESISIPIPSTMSGFNTIIARVKNTDGVWSLYQKNNFYILPAATYQTLPKDIVAGEYYFNTDPGYGNGTSFNISGTNPTESLTIPLPNNMSGFNFIYFRVKNSDDVWSLYQRANFYVTTISNLPALSEIDGAEFFYDTDPGIGSGTAVTLVPTGNAEKFTVDLSAANIPCGKHNFYVRVKNTNGTYSLYDIAKDVMVTEDVAPVVATKNISVNMDANGNATITAAMIDNGSTDNCAIAEKTLDKTAFSCSNLGANTVTLTVKDTSGNTASKTAIVTVIDNISPKALAKDISVQLQNGTVTITPQQIDNGSSDNCSISQMTLSQTTFTESGTFTVTLKVKDTSGNESQANAQVTVTGASLSTENIAKDEVRFEVYPVPVKDILNIQSKIEVKEAQVYDISGKLIKKMSVNNQKIDLSYMPNSIYIIIFSDGTGQKFIKKVIKN